MRDARLSLLTLGVADLERARRFYEALGWSRVVPEAEGVVFLQREGIVLSLFGLEVLADDAGLPSPGAALPRFRGTAFALNMPTRAEVDRLYATALAAGADATRSPEEASWGGWRGYFADPDGHLWEVAHNPFFPLDARGAVDLSHGMVTA